jgi:hypothetical protein
MDNQTIQNNIRTLNTKLNEMINKMKKRNTIKNNRAQVNTRNTRAGRLNLLPARGSRVQRMAANIEAKIAAQR